MINKTTVLAPMNKCPRFFRCSVPICPLDPDKDKRVYLQGEPRCTLAKSIRRKLGKDLPWKGLFPREFSALNRWEKKSPEDKSKFIAGGDKNRFVAASRRYRGRGGQIDVAGQRVSE